MQDLRVTLIQSEQHWEDKSANLAMFDAKLEQIEATDLIVLPEMFSTSFTMNAAAMAEKMESSPTLAWLTQKAKDKNAAIYTSFIVEEETRYYNRGIFMYPNGNYEIYNKRQLFSLAKEDTIFTPGNEQVIVSWKGWNILLQICFDLRFPEIQRNGIDPTTGKAYYDIMLTVANWPEKRSHHWKSLLLARAIENQCYVIGVNRVGSDSMNLTYSGDSSVINALGEIEITSSLHDKKVEFLLNSNHLPTVRNQFSFLKDIRG